MKRSFIVILASLILLTSCNISQQTGKIPDATEESSAVTTGALSEDNNEMYGSETCDEVELVSAAIKSGDRASLTDEKDIYVYDEVTRIISQIITDDMSVYEKELAVHDYIVKNVQYDPDGIDEFSEPSEDSYYPYGTLKNKKAVCLGYTRTFQLFMEVLDIPCLTIHATAYGNEEHGWNMVQLDGDWYHVDVTWDDPVPDTGDKVSHSFFNVTDIKMKITTHNWDTDVFPEADSRKYAYKG